MSNIHLYLPFSSGCIHITPYCQWYRSRNILENVCVGFTPSMIVDMPWKLTQAASIPGLLRQAETDHLFRSEVCSDPTRHFYSMHARQRLAWSPPGAKCHVWMLLWSLKLSCIVHGVVVINYVKFSFSVISNTWHVLFVILVWCSILSVLL